MTSAGGAARAAEGPVPGGRAGEGEARLALVVDDENKVRDLMVQALSEAGFRCLSAPEGEGALEVLGQERPHVAVLDLSLPGMSGAELAWRLKQRWPELPVLAVSGYLEQWDGDDLKDLGFSKLMGKPLDWDELVRWACKAAGGGGSSRAAG